MRVNEIDSFESLDLCQIQAEGLKRAFELSLGPIGNLRPWLGSAHMQVAGVRVLRSPAVHLDFDLLRQFPAQVIDVNACTPIYQWRILACE